MTAAAPEKPEVNGKEVNDPFPESRKHLPEPTPEVPSKDTTVKAPKKLKPGFWCSPEELSARKSTRLAKFELQKAYKANKAEARERHRQRRAKSRQARYTDTAAALANVYRIKHAIQGVLAVVAAGGTAWTTWNVAHALGGSSPHPIYFVVEPLFTMPLLAIVILQTVAAAFGRLHEVAPLKNEQGKWRPTTIGWVEFALLVASVLLNGWPAFTAEDATFEQIAPRVAAPVLLVVVAAIQLLVARVTSSIILSLTSDDADASTVQQRSVAAFDKAVAALPLLDAGEFGGDYPSKQQLQRAVRGQAAVLGAASHLVPKLDEFRKGV